ncbi:MAG: hypothetical protein JSR55_06005 [Proteobacteria bacterium]|nr:hypothetical protein [Pseudomonadota bacterium]
MTKREKKHDMRDGMWERGPADLDEGRGEAEQQAREDIDPDNPRLARPGFGVTTPGQTTHQ